MIQVAVSVFKTQVILPWSSTKPRCRNHAKASSASRSNQARADMEHGTLRLAGYMEALGGVRPPFASSTEKMLDEWELTVEWLVANRQNRVQWVLLWAEGWRASDIMLATALLFMVLAIMLARFRVRRD